MAGIFNFPGLEAGEWTERKNIKKKKKKLYIYIYAQNILHGDTKQRVVKLRLKYKCRFWGNKILIVGKRSRVRLLFINSITRADEMHFQAAKEMKYRAKLSFQVPLTDALQLHLLCILIQFFPCQCYPSGSSHPQPHPCHLK